jgi:Transposase IS66 family
VFAVENQTAALASADRVHDTELNRLPSQLAVSVITLRIPSSLKTLTTAARHIGRQETARPLLDDIRSKIEAAQFVALPSSALSKACQYALTLWRKLTRFLEYPQLELSNNLAENSMRPVALGRKNWIHIAVHRQDRRLQRFSRSWKAAAG